jgi:hypothetical protein
MSLRLQKRIAAATAIVGLAGALAMGYFESEPGALPLALLLGGGLWWFVAWRRLRAGARPAP